MLVLALNHYHIMLNWIPCGQITNRRHKLIIWQYKKLYSVRVSINPLIWLLLVLNITWSFWTYITSLQTICDCWVPGTQYYRARRNRVVDSGYPKPLSAWNGLPETIDTALQWTNGRTYFFKDNDYYRYNDQTDSVSSIRYFRVFDTTVDYELWV